MFGANLLALKLTPQKFGDMTYVASFTVTLLLLYYLFIIYMCECLYIHICIYIYTLKLFFFMCYY